MKILSKLDNTGMIEEVADKRFVTDAEKLTWNGKADKTYVDSQDALKADKTYVDNKVKTDVPVGAKFTDTVYSHPASHPASMITGLPTSLPANGGNADTVGGFTVGVNVPANAKFTDTNTTYSEITTAEIDAGTASTLRTITGRRVKYILDKVQGWIGGLTKSDVGLSNVDNVKQASKTEFDGHNNDATRHITSVERTNLNSNTSARHSHTNKATLDKITEVGGELKYNGETVVTKTSFTWARLKGAMSWAELIGM